MHDPDFRQAERDWFSMAAALTERLVEIDDTVPELPVKDIVSCSPRRVHNNASSPQKCTRLSDGHLINSLTLTAQIFRIYRDVRFSKDPAPYNVAIPSHSASESARGESVTASPSPLPHLAACISPAYCNSR